MITGQPVAAVIAASREEAEDIAEQVFVDIDPEDAVVDVDDALQLRTTLWNGDALFPHRHAVGDVQRDHFTGRQASHREAVGNQRSTGATQGQNGRGAVIHPALRTGGGIQTDQTIVLGCGGVASLGFVTVTLDYMAPDAARP